MGNAVGSRTKSVDELADEIVALTKDCMDSVYPDKSGMRRDVHPKTLGLVKAEFKVLENLDPSLRVGVFATPGKTFPAWVRFSSSFQEIQSDWEPDLRGMAIKLLNPADGKTPLNQDFVTMNTQVLPLGKPEVFRDLVYFTRMNNSAALMAGMILCGHFNRMKRVLAARSVIESLRGQKYHSTTPYAFGEDQMVKYALFPVNYVPPPPAEGKDVNYLTLELQQHLEKNDIEFDFYVQFRKEGMEIEDAGVAWEESQSEFIKVAKLTIKKQIFTTPERFEQAERMQFNVGHALPEHKPVGRLNLVRVKVYQKLSEYRLHESGRLL